MLWKLQVARSPVASGDMSPVSWPWSELLTPWSHDHLFTSVKDIRLRIYAFCHLSLPKWSFYIIRQAPRQSGVFHYVTNDMTVLLLVIMREGSCHSAKKHSWLRITLQTFRLIHIMDRTTMPAAHCLGVIPRFKGLTGKDYQQLPFSLELVINQTTHFRVSF